MSRLLDPTGTTQHDVLTLSTCRWGALLALQKGRSDYNTVQAAALQLTILGQLPVGVVLGLDFTTQPETEPRDALEGPRDALEAINRMKM